MPYLMHLFAGIQTLHFEDCRIEPGRDLWLLTTLKRFAKLRHVLHNNRLVLDLTDRFEDREFGNVKPKKEKQRDQLKRISQLYECRVDRMHL